MIPGNDVCFLHRLFIIFLTAGGSVPEISVTPSTLNVIEGDEALFECLGVGDPTPTIRWSREKGRLFFVIFVREWRANHFLNEA